MPSTPFTLRVAPDYETMSAWAAATILQRVRGNPCLLGLATGSTPTRTYELLGNVARREPQLFQELRVLKLDEWGGLEMDDPATCETYLRRLVLGPLAISNDRYFAWESNPPDSAAECMRMATWLAREGPIDLCVLGLGVNGHLAFNEPADALQPGPHVAQLSANSLSHAMLTRARRPPSFGLTLGIADLLRSRSILLLVSGSHKADPLRRLLEPRVTPHFPASFLWLHPDVTIFTDLREMVGD